MAHRKLRNFMLDTETLSLAPNAVFWQVAAVEFNINADNGIAVPGNSLAMLACPAAARMLVEDGKAVWSQDTVDWLLQQPAIRDLFGTWWDCFNKAEKFPSDIPWSMESLTYPEIFGQMTRLFGGDREAVQVWAKGADFDFPILTNATRAYGILEPWHYRNKNCLRTWQNEAVRLGMVLGKPDNDHDAYSDCIGQIRILEHVRRYCVEYYRR